MQSFPIDHQGYQLLHEGSLALSQIQSNGMLVDVSYYQTQDRRLTKKINRIDKRLGEFKEVQAWKKRAGTKFNINSDTQLSHLLFKTLELKPSRETAGGGYSTDEESLKALNLPFLNLLLQRRKYEKVQGTYIGGILREQVNGWLHPFFNLHTVISYRGSCSNINFQNIPVRIEEIKRMVRSGFLPRSIYRCFGEADYGGIEVAVAACYHKDPAMIADITDPARDMHRDMAMECYMLDMGEWTKETRYCGKNKFVFPEFYGDYYINCAKNLWAAISQLGLKTAQGIPLESHLNKKGIKNFKAFENHIQEVERKFWEDRYPVYNQWKEDHVKSYHENGYFDSLTGFRYQGIMSRNEAINYAVQGSAFHCLLWSLIQMQKIAVAEKWETKIIGQIHDALVIDFEPSEINHVIKTMKKIMTVDLLEKWPWIIIPMEVEVELAPAGKSWNEKNEVTKQTPCVCGNEWLYKIRGQNGVGGFCPICN